jgi:transglutaminase-like putative cysteine protease
MAAFGHAPAPQAARLVQGDARPGLAFRVIWFEPEDPSRRAVVSRFVFPVGCEYDSQEIHAIHPVRPGGGVEEDAHGNSILRYPEALDLPAGQPLLLGYVNEVDLFPDAFLHVNPRRARKGLEAPEEIRETYLRDDEILTLGDPEIAAEAARLAEEADGELDLLLRTWEFVHRTLTYSRRVERPNTAAQVLEWRKGQCGEYGKLSIALLRANGIPARGVWCLRSANTGPKHNDHAWAEAWLGGIGWCPLRPQEEPPREYRFPLGYHSYLVVCRPQSGMDEYRRVETENVVMPTGYRGAGFFADVPRGERADAVELFQAIAADDQAENAGKHLKLAHKVHRAVQPMMYWVLAASADDKAAEDAAAKLVELCSLESRRLDLGRFLAVSPAVVQRRISALRGVRDR